MDIRIFEVGGCVRDRFLGRKCKDIDYAVEAPSFQAMVQFILDKGGRIFLEKPEYHTVRAKLENVDADFVLCRKDGSYSDGRRPDSVAAGTILDDLSRRDFAMNAVALDVAEGTHFDPFEGVKDIEAQLIRCVGRTEDRFSEDSLRMLRAIRFSISLGFKMSEEIQAALHENSLVDKLANVSEERIREELLKCFRVDTLATLELLHRFPKVRNIIFSADSKVWLTPTMQER